ncbi:MAG: aerobic carbon-monoxide dehydrogenase small subunit [Mycobacterium sp.]|jgi:aerobic-type carbon monoxide dehydrogenase small subunit (CoxS/CutS family)|nr:aerobic carbon-monoxide dehydrogenase small subunit [Mycobacterium sp.]
MSAAELDIVEISLHVNGTPIERAVAPRALLVDFLREDLGLTGTKISCELQVCGVCTVLVDDRPVSSCTFLAVDADGAHVRTVEGLAEDGAPNRLQEAFLNHHALQCGFCTPGFLMMSTALIESGEAVDRHAVVEHLEGNICRCTGYLPIIDAVCEVAAMCPRRLSATNGHETSHS